MTGTSPSPSPSIQVGAQAVANGATKPATTACRKTNKNRRCGAAIARTSERGRTGLPPARTSTAPISPPTVPALARAASVARTARPVPQAYGYSAVSAEGAL